MRNKELYHKVDGRAGRRWGVSHTKGYVAVGTPAKGKLINGRYVYSDGGNRHNLGTSTVDSKPDAKKIIGDVVGYGVLGPRYETMSKVWDESSDDVRKAYDDAKSNYKAYKEQEKVRREEADKRAKKEAENYMKDVEESLAYYAQKEKERKAEAAKKQAYIDEQKAKFDEQWKQEHEASKSKGRKFVEGAINFLSGAHGYGGLSSVNDINDFVEYQSALADAQKDWEQDYEKKKEREEKEAAKKRFKAMTLPQKAKHIRDKAVNKAGDAAASALMAYYMSKF